MFTQTAKIVTQCRNFFCKSWFNQASLSQRFFGYVFLSWLFSLGAQVAIPLPFNLVPLVLNPLPLLLAVRLLGMHAVYSYGLYLLQGLCGLPCFILFQAGPLYLFGPTGGYTFGFGIAMLFFALVKKNKILSRPMLLTVLTCCMAIYFSVGLAQLSFFVRSSDLFSVGFYPFILGESCKILTILIFFENDKY